MIDPLLVFRVKRAWDKLRPEDKARLRPHIADAHDDLQTILGKGRGKPVKSKRELLYVHSSLESDLEVLLKATAVALDHAMGFNVQPPLDDDGDILGFGKFQILDPGWLEAAAVWLECYYTQPPPFQEPAAIKVPERFTLALAADWGTGTWGTSPSPSMKVAACMAALKPEVTVHLGDVYYAGTDGPEKHILVDQWPAGTLCSCTLNSNHEMYPVAKPYFEIALRSEKFAAQQGSSVFLMENEHWIIVGLDTAYCSDKENLYMDGAINEQQVAMLGKAGASGKKIVLLSHHNALCEDGSHDQYTKALYEAVTAALKPGRAALWYWGHVHCGAVYARELADGTGCRCIGHAALPWGEANALSDNPNVVWHETKLAGDARDTQRVCNGFAVLRFEGDAVREEIWNENGEVSWRS